MIVEKIKITKDGSEILLRCATAEDAEMLLSGYKKMLGETQFLSRGPDEISLTVEQEKTFIEGSNKDKDKLLLLAFVNGKYAGNCNFAGKTASRRTAHRASLGIAVFQEFTGKGLGKIMLEKLLTEAKKAGFEQMELTVYADNIRARSLYEKFGFFECGRIPDARRISGAGSDEIRMYKKL